MNQSEEQLELFDVLLEPMARELSYWELMGLWMLGDLDEVPEVQ